MWWVFRDSLRNRETMFDDTISLSFELVHNSQFSKIYYIVLEWFGRAIWTLVAFSDALLISSFFLTKFKFNIVSQTSLWDALTVHGHRGLYSSTIFREILVDHTFANSNLRVITFTSLLVLIFSVNGFMKKCFQNDSKNSKKKKRKLNLELSLHNLHIRSC